MAVSRIVNENDEELGARYLQAVPQGEAMPFQVVHPQDFPRLFGTSKVPSKSTLKRWRETRGFPASLSVPRGHYRLEEVQAWFARLGK